MNQFIVIPCFSLQVSRAIEQLGIFLISHHTTAFTKEMRAHEAEIKPQQCVEN